MKALLVDDEHDFLEQTKIFIENNLESLKLDTVSNVQDALQKLENHEYSAIISDYQMGEMNGLEFLKIIREEKNSNIPFIIFTGRGREDVAIEALNLGANRYIHKGGDPRSQYGVLSNALINEIDSYKKDKRLKNSRSKKESIDEVDQSEKGLKISKQNRKTLQKRYKALYERSLDGIYLFNFEGDFIDANPKALEMIGYSKEELNSLNYKDIFTNKSIKKIDKTTKNIIENGAQDDPTELKLKRKDGNEIWVETKTHVLYKDNEPYAFQGIAREITERKKIEKKMKKKERAIQNSLNGITIADLNGNVTYVNDSLVNMWGFDNQDEILGRDTLDFFENKEKTQKVINKLLENGRWKGELRGKRKDGSTIDVFLSANLIHDDEGNSTNILASIIDISENKSTNRKIEKLHDITQKLERCEEENEVYNLAIEAAERILDFEMCSIDSVESNSFVVKATSSNVDEEGSIDTSLDEGIAGRTYKEGDSFIVDDLNKNENAEPVKDNYRSALSVPIGDFGVFQAVSTGKKQFDEQDVNMAELLMDHVAETLKRIKSSKKQDFLHSLLRHDVKNKTQIVEGYLQLLKDSELNDLQSDFTDKALKATREGQSILKKVKTLREIKEEDVKEKNIKVPLKKAIRSNKEFVEKSNISINWDEKDCIVKGGALLEELFFNIINNAVNHSKGENIDITVEETENDCIIQIKDDGVGIPEEEKGAIFERGYKKGNKAGTGLGLHLVKTIVESYDGNIEVKDSRLGGARFDIYLKKAQ